MAAKPHLYGHRPAELRKFSRAGRPIHQISLAMRHVHVNVIRVGGAEMKQERSQKYRPVIEETAQSSAPIRGRGASWSPANRFERLHVDHNDVDVVDPDPGDVVRPRRATQFFRDGTKTIITRNNSPDVGFETSVNPYRGCE
ncbi:MAG: hypothetical protein DMF46_09045, partial [Verrucomicrobia bacterium]